MSKAVVAGGGEPPDPAELARIRQYLIDCYQADPFGTAKYLEELSRLPAGSVSLIDPEVSAPSPRALPPH